MLAPNASAQTERRSMYNANKLKIGLFGANCSSGRAVTLVPERWSGSWPDNLKLVRMADEAGLDFMLPIGRWKGYGGDTDYQGATLETITWATGLLASSKRITVFGTVHAPLFNPIMAAKEMVTADQIGEGRFGLNIVVGWNEGEFEMFGVQQREHEQRYEYAQEWIDVIKTIWSDKEDFDFNGQYLETEEDPRQAEALWRHPAGDHECRRFAGRPGVRDPQLRRVLPAGVAHVARRDRAARDQRQDPGQGAWPRTRRSTPSASSPAGRPGRRRRTTGTTRSSRTPTGTRSTAFSGSRTSPRRIRPAEKFQQIRNGYAQGMGGLPMVGDPGRRGASAGRPQQGGIDRHRHLAGQLCRRAAVLLRRGAAAARAHGAAREAVSRLALRSSPRKRGPRY